MERQSNREYGSGIQLRNNKLQFMQEDKHIKEGIRLGDDEQQYMLPHFTMLLIGKPGSGKTSLIKQLVKNPQLYKDKFNDTFVVSPSHAKMNLNVENKYCNSAFSLDWIFSKLNDINTEQLVAQQKAYNTYRGTDDDDCYDSNTAAKVKTKIGIPPDIFDNSQRLINRLYSGKSRFFGNGDKPKVLLGPTPTIQQRKKVQQQANGKRLTGPMKVPKTLDLGFQGQLPQQSFLDMMKAQEEAELQHQQYNQKQLNELPDDLREKFYRNVLLILDDVVADIKKNETNPLLGKLIMNRRHLIHNGMLSIIIVSQKYTMIPARVRSNANWVVTFKMNPLDSETMYRDVVHMPREQWEQIQKFVFGDCKDASNECDDMNSMMKNKKHDNLSVWVEFDLYFKNFKLIQL